MLNVCENTVRATHVFLTEKDIALFKLMIMEQAFPIVTLKCAKEIDGAIFSFVDIHDSEIEMLFYSY